MNFPLRQSVLLILWMTTLFVSAQEPPPGGQAPNQAYLRYVCAAPGDEQPKLFGEWPQFKPGLRLVLEGGAAGSQGLSSDLLPLSSGGYQPVAPGAARIIIVEIPADPTPVPQKKVRGSVNFQPKAGSFYTLLIRGEGSSLNLELIEDEPAVLKPAKPNEEPPPPRRSLRCWVLEPAIRVRISCPQAALNLEAGSEKPGRAENLKKGLWALDIQGEWKGQAFNTTVELDLEVPGNWSMFFMRDIYGRVAPTLLKDASLD